ncbi:unnamed protein product [Ambrosiozyma monospora]|uniref:Unnamed protein product n=1 Tax=Ambrosiozyma monospora TaxID=43982 RepID=A0ACB5SZE0_AMBMO|nr:unnamed protein product [Ambrosiozyma monospora]
MRLNTLSALLNESLEDFEGAWSSNSLKDKLTDWIKLFPNQVLILTMQVHWTKVVEESAGKREELDSLREFYQSLLGLLSGLVLNDLKHLDRLKIENVVIETLHQKNVIEDLLKQKNPSLKSFDWRSQQRYYLQPSLKSPFESLIVKQGNASFVYGYEYLGVPNRLVYTPLVNTCFASLTETLNQRLGGSLVGPAGTGKTESVKALGQNLGRMVLVFCCDETFDYQAVTRILIGICRTGTWGCFDEFNRLDENMLSAIATEIEKIETALSVDGSSEAVILGKNVQVHKDSGIFITSNPGYAGRTVLPDNLKNKYRTFSIVKPDSLTIAEVLLTSQGFYNAHFLSEKIVPLFGSLNSDCSRQSHYDFGLRALKSVLRNCGLLKRSAGSSSTAQDAELHLIVRSLYNVVLPKLLPSDEPVFEKTVRNLGLEFDFLHSNPELVSKLREVADQKQINSTDDWLKKAVQLYEISNSHHGLIMVGDPGCGKTTIFECLTEAMIKLSGKENITYTLDPKVLGKAELYGDLDYATRDWTDGVFTSILRKVNSNFRGEKSKNVWIVFDGDVDPNWVENLNSVLDDNKLLTLPNGERISLPDNVKIVFEVDSLNYATPATVSRCGVIWFGSTLYHLEGYYNKLLFDFGNAVNDLDGELLDMNTNIAASNLRGLFTDAIANVLPVNVLEGVWKEAQKYSHLMNFNLNRCLDTFFALQQVAFKELLSFTIEHPEESFEDIPPFVGKHVLISLVWSFTGDCPLADREYFSTYLVNIPHFLQYSGGLDQSLVYSNVALPDLKWISYSLKVPTTAIEPYMITQPDVVIPTLDTVRHEDLIYSLLNERKPVILCGPPGSGKTMTLMAALRKSSQFIFVGLNFSKETSPDQILKTLEHHCIYKKTSNGSILTPNVAGKWLVVFCDEINLPELDSYGTQTTISFLRQLAEQNTFWKRSTHEWVSLQNIQFVGACNPPTDPGRNTLSDRFLRHCSLFMVDYPGQESLTQIYRTFNHASLKCVPDLLDYADTLTGAMLQVYQKSRERFKVTQKMHYVYSPRELTRWIRGFENFL